MGLRLTTKRELTLLHTVIQEQAKTIERLELRLAESNLFWTGRVEHERKRAEGAMNALLAAKARVTIPTDAGHSTRELDASMDVFGDQAEIDAQQKDLMERLQG